MHNFLNFFYHIVHYFIAVFYNEVTCKKISSNGMVSYGCSHYNDVNLFNFFADSQIKLTVTPNLGNLYVGFNKTLTLNCSISQPTYGLLPEQLIWQHNNSWKPNVTYVLNNRTVQLRTNYLRDDDAGLYRCVVFYNASKFKDVHSNEIRVLVAGMQIHN